MNRTYIITGPLQSGKTTFIKEASERFSRTLKVKGFYSPKHYVEGVFAGYNLVNIESRAEIPFIRLRSEPGWIKFRRFNFNPQAFAAGEAIIEAAGGADILIIDEMGPLEISGGGFMGAVSQAFERYESSMVIVCRDYIVDDLIRLMERFKRKAHSLEQSRWDELFAMVSEREVL